FKLSTQTIRGYFPNVSGLTFINENNQKCGLSIVNDKFELLPGVSKYEVHSCNILKEHNVNDIKRKRITEIMRVIEGKSSDKSASVENQEYEVPAKKVKKIIFVGWRHKANPQDNRYVQMKGFLGGIKQIE
ncbi:GSCOCG00003193001-RA-CDS, partial [Cotesia congregata]